MRTGPWNLTLFRKIKCKGLHLGQGNPQCKFRMNKSSIALPRRTWECWRLLSWEWAFAAQKNNTFGCTQSTEGSRVRKRILPLCSVGIPPAVLPPALGLQHRKDVELFEPVQRRPAR